MPVFLPIGTRFDSTITDTKITMVTEFGPFAGFKIDKIGWRSIIFPTECPIPPTSSFTTGYQHDK